MTEWKEKLTFEELQNQVIGWGAARGLLNTDNGRMQLLKTMEELGETVGAVLKGRKEEAADGFGDVLVTLILAAKLEGFDLVECLGLAWNEIAARKGNTVDGVFVRD